MPRVNKSIKKRKASKLPTSAASAGETPDPAEQTLHALRELFASIAEISVAEVGAGEADHDREHMNSCLQLIHNYQQS